MIRQKSLIQAAIAAFLLNPLSLKATTVLETSVGNLSNGAVWIGRVDVSETQTKDVPGFPVTVVKGQIQEIFKGRGHIGDTIHVEVPGGQREDKTQIVTALPVFHIGAQYILFLNSDPMLEKNKLASVDRPGLVSWTAYRIIKGEDGQEVVVRQGDPVVLARHQNRVVLRHQTNAPEGYDVFVDRIFRELN